MVFFALNLLRRDHLKKTMPRETGFISGSAPLTHSFFLIALNLLLSNLCLAAFGDIFRHLDVSGAIIRGYFCSAQRGRRIIVVVRVVRFNLVLDSMNKSCLNVHESRCESQEQCRLPRHEDNECASHCPKSSAFEAKMAMLDKLQAFFGEPTSSKPCTSRILFEYKIMTRISSAPRVLTWVKAAARAALKICKALNVHL